MEDVILESLCFFPPCKLPASEPKVVCEASYLLVGHWEDIKIRPINSYGILTARLQKKQLSKYFQGDNMMDTDT